MLQSNALPVAVPSSSTASASSCRRVVEGGLHAKRFPYARCRQALRRRRSARCRDARAHHGLDRRRETRSRRCRLSTGASRDPNPRRFLELCSVDFSVENKSDGRSARVRCGERILAPRDSANLDDKPPKKHRSRHERNARMAAAGSPDFIRCSPTRNAWKPAARRRVTSRCE